MIHCYKFDDKNIVLDVFSGSIHMVDEVAYEIIQMYEDHTREQIIEAVCPKFNVTEADVDECIADIEAFKEAGKLFAPDKYANIAYDLKKRKWTLKALCLHVAHTCNLNCSYCFAAQGKFHGKKVS